VADDEHKRRRESLLPLGRRCPEGADEGAFSAGVAVAGRLG
jgi:hypothetical protein